MLPQDKKKAKGEKDMDDLKQELEMDEHSIPIEQLYARYSTDPDKVCHSFLLASELFTAVNRKKKATAIPLLSFKNLFVLCEGEPLTELSGQPQSDNLYFHIMSIRLVSKLLRWLRVLQTPL